MEVKKETIENHRAKFPLPFDEITFYSSFEQLLGKTPNDYKPNERYDRWSKAMNLLRENGHEDEYDFWATIKGSNESCYGCALRDEQRNWCRWSELPPNYNPILKDVGMACMGLGYEGQQIIKFEN